MIRSPLMTVMTDAVMAAQWYLTAEYLGARDAWLEDYVKTMDPVQREAAEQGARNWVR